MDRKRARYVLFCFRFFQLSLSPPSGFKEDIISLGEYIHLYLYIHTYIHTTIHTYITYIQPYIHTTIQPYIHSNVISSPSVSPPTTPHYMYNPSGTPSFFLYNTFSFAFLKSVWVTRIRRSRNASSPASVHTAFTSAPDKSSLLVTNSSMFTSSASVIFPVWIWKMRRFVLISGNGNSILRSIRPGRIKAGSRESMRLVACVVRVRVWVM